MFLTVESRIMKLLLKFLLIIITSVPAVSQYWEQITTIPAPYDRNYWLDVYFLPSNINYGWVCGFNGAVIRTTDGGATWTGDTIAGAYHLESIHFPTQNIGYTSGVEGIWKTTDGGANWFSVKPSQATDSIHFWGTYFYDADNGVLVGMGCSGSRQYFWRTTNGGSSWTFFNGNEFDSGLTDAILHATGLGYASSSGKLWRTTDGGYNWTVFSTTGTNLWQEEITYFNQSFLVPYAGNTCSGGGADNGGMRFSTDAGATWTDVNVGTSMFGAFVLSPNEAWACGYNQAIYHTTDAGQTWQLKNCGVGPGHLDDIWFTSQNQGWVVGQGVYKLSSGTQKISKTQVDFGDGCINAPRKDTLFLYNYNFNTVSASWQLQGTDPAAFTILEPAVNFTLQSCMPQRIIVEFNPSTPGIKTANLRIAVPGYPTIFVGLRGRAIRPSAAPSDTLLIVDSLRCSTTHIASLTWKVDNNLYNEYINTYQQSGSQDVILASQLPLKVIQSGTDTKFSITPSDTGWQSAKFDFTLTPCDLVTTVTVKFYGISPIINSEELVESAAECEYFTLLEVPVFNTGNADLNISKLEILEPVNGFAVSGWKSGYNQPRILKPGEADTVIIKYQPLVPGVKSSKLRITNNDETTARGKKNPYDVELKASLLYSKIDTKDTIIDFGEICIGDSVFRSVKLANSGNLSALVRSIYYSTDEVQFTPKSNIYPIQISAFDTLKAFVSLRPLYTGNYSDTIVLYMSPCEQAINIIVKARVIKSEATLSPQLISGTVLNYGSDTAGVSVTNRGTDTIRLTGYTFSPDTKQWPTTLIPALPQDIPPGETIDFKLVFSTKQDSALVSQLCFDTQSYCPVELCTDVNYKSLHVSLEIEPNPLDFGLQTCLIEPQVKKIRIYNLSNEPMTIKTIDIDPDNVGFSILNLPAMPYTLAIGDSIELDIQFVAPGEGVYKTQLVVQTLMSVAMIDLIGKFRNALINPVSITTEISDIEPCYGIIENTYKFWNNGTLTDTLDVTITPNANYYYTNKNVLVIPPSDTAELTVSFDPAKAPLDDMTNFTVNLKSRVCENLRSSINFSVRVFKPGLSLTPNPVEFPNVWPGDTLTRNITITNNSQVDITVNSLNIPAVNPNIYIINKTLPFDIPVNQSENLTVNFIAQKTGQYSDSLLINYSADCEYDTSIVISSSVSDETYNVQLSIDDYVTSPYETIYIAINLDGKVHKFRPDSVMIELGFDPWLFDPQRAFYITDDGAVEIPAILYPGYAKLHIPEQFADTMFLTEGKKINIEGQTYPSSPNKTHISFLNVEIYSEKVINFTKDDGSLEVTPVCNPTARLHLILSDEIQVFVQNNIVENGQLPIAVNSTGNVTAVITVYSSNGSEILSETTNFVKGTNDLRLDLSNLTDGVYYFVLKSSTGQLFTDKFVIIR